MYIMCMTYKALFCEVQIELYMHSCCTYRTPCTWEVACVDISRNVSNNFLWLLLVVAASPANRFLGDVQRSNQHRWSDGERGAYFSQSIKESLISESAVLERSEISATRTGRLEGVMELHLNLRSLRALLQFRKSPEQIRLTRFVS